METKVCRNCKQKLPIENFYTFYSSRNPDRPNYTVRCIKCELEFRKIYHKLPEVKDRSNKQRREKRKNDLEYKNLINLQQRERYRKNQVNRLFYNVKERSKRLGIEYNISKEDIIIPEYCPILGVKLVQGIKDNYLYTPSIDRIDNTKGYIKGNIAIISMLANTMKNSASTEHLIAFAKNIINYLQINNDIVQPIGKIEPIESKDKEP